jgi:hypothetical protein
MKGYRYLKGLVLLTLLTSMTACSGEETETITVEPTVDTGLQPDVGIDLESDEGNLCGEATPCGTNSDCASDEYCDNGCCAEATIIPNPEEECGDIDYEGICDGDIVRWCDDGLLEVDCSTYFDGLDVSVTSTCTYVGAGFGYWCAVSPGDECLFDDGDGVNFHACAGTEPACVMTTAGSECVENGGTCDESVVGYCNNDWLVVDCFVVQPAVWDCASAGGFCNEEAGLCSGIPEGEECEEGLLECAEGLSCDDGTCAAAETYDVEFSGSGFDDFEGALFMAALLDADSGDILMRDETVIEDGEFEMEWDDALTEGLNYTIDYFVDADMDSLCDEDEDLTWQEEVEDTDEEMEIDLAYDEDDDADEDICDSFSDSFELEIEGDNFDDYEDLTIQASLVDTENMGFGLEEAVLDSSSDEVSGSGSFDLEFDVVWGESYHLDFYIDSDDTDGDCEPDVDLVFQIELGTILNHVTLEVDLETLEAGDDCASFGSGEESTLDDSGDTAGETDMGMDMSGTGDIATDPSLDG